MLATFRFNESTVPPLKSSIFLQQPGPTNAYTGAAVGVAVGAAVGAAIGAAVGAAVGVAVGAAVGAAVGCTVQIPHMYGHATRSPVRKLESPLPVHCSFKSG